MHAARQCEAAHKQNHLQRLDKPAEQRTVAESLILNEVFDAADWVQHVAKSDDLLLQLLAGTVWSGSCTSVNSSV